MGAIQNLIGQKYGKLTVVEEAPKKANRTAWYCKCDCGNANLIHVTGNNLRTGKTKSCGCAKKESKIIDMTGWKMWEHGVINSKIIVIEMAGQDKYGDVIWKCRCNCGNGNDFICNGKELRNGSKLSCGCHKLNNYDLTKEYGIGYTKNTGSIFYFDLEDYFKIKDYVWQEETGGYIVTYINNKRLFMHNLISNSKAKTQDHKNGNRKDNRKNNLRYANALENSRNRKTPKNNLSGCKGECLSKSGKYRAYITVNHKWLSLGEYTNFEEAKKARTEAEIKYFGEFRRDEKKN